MRLSGICDGILLFPAWDAAPAPEVTTYRVYFGTNAGPVRIQTVLVTYLGRWFFAATAADANGVESDFSNMVASEARPAAPIVKGEPQFRLLPALWHGTNQ